MVIILGYFLLAPGFGSMEIPDGLPAAGIEDAVTKGQNRDMSLLFFGLRFWEGLSSRRRNMWYRALGVRMHGYVWMRRASIPRQWSDISLHGFVKLDDGVVLLCSGPPQRDKLVIGSGTYVNRYSLIDASTRLEVGRDCMIGPHCYLTDHDHEHGNGRLVSEGDLIGEPTLLGNNVWLGAGVIVLKGVVIGDNVVVGAGAVVTKSVAAGAKVVGAPARSLPGVV